MKTSKLKTVVLIVDIVAFVTVVALHIASNLMRFKHAHYLTVLYWDYRLYFLGLPWALSGIVKGFIARLGSCEKRLIAAILTGLTFFAVWYTIDCAAVCTDVETTFSSLLYGTFFKTFSPFFHTAYFLAIYLLRAELPIFIRNIKTIGLKNTIFGEED